MSKRFLKFELIAITVMATAVPRLNAQMGNDDPYGTGDGFNGGVITGCSYSSYTGTATRAVTDFVVAGSVGEYPLAFTRTAVSRSAPNIAGDLGGCGNWFHSYEWSIDEAVRTKQQVQKQWESKRLRSEFP